MGRVRGKARPLEVLGCFLQEIPLRAHLAGLPDLELDVEAFRASLASRIRGLFPSDATAAPVLAAVERALADPRSGLERGSTIALILEMFDDIEADLEDVRLEERRDAKRLREKAAAAAVVLAGLEESKRRVSGLDETVDVLRRLRGVWIADADELARQAGDGKRRGGRPRRLLNIHQAVAVLQSCGLAYRVARRLAAAAAK